MSYSVRWNRAYIWLAVAGVVLVITFLVVGLARQRGHGDAQKALLQLAQVESVHVRSELNLNLPLRLRGQDRPFTEMIAQVEGDVRRAGSGTPELTGTLHTEARGRGNIFFADGEARILEDDVMFRLAELPVFLNPSGSLVERWTRVGVPLLKTNNADEVREVFSEVFAGLTAVGKEDVAGKRLTRFTGQLSADQEESLIAVLHQNESGNRALHVLARLLEANNVKSFNVWIDQRMFEVRHIEVDFVRPLDDGKEFDFAKLTLMFSDYNKEVVIDRPESELAVKPEVFAKLFGAGEFEKVE